MYGRRNYLFGGASVHALIEDVQARAMADLKSTNENIILGKSVDDLVSELLNKYALNVPELNEDGTWVDEKEVNIEVPVQEIDFVYAGRRGGTRTVTSHVVSFHVPFEGDGTLFQISPSSRTIPGPAADIDRQEIVISVSTNQKTHEQVKQEYNQTVQSIKQHLSTLKNDLRSVGTQIETSARAYIQQRKAQILQSKNLVASLGFPMKRRADAPMTYRAPEVRRKVTPISPQTMPPFKPEPALEEAEYQHILNVMDNMTKVMERSPSAFRNMEEEDIRHQFLVQLNGQYEGQATGETFNFSGKTDILIRSDGKNIFIAECKFWRGEKSFLETVNQLLSYLTWRDSKAAIIIFNKNKNLSGVLSAIKSAMEQHPNKKRGPKIEGETRFRYIMHSPSDINREIIVTIMIYDIPSPE